MLGLRIWLGRGSQQPQHVQLIENLVMLFMAHHVPVGASHMCDSQWVRDIIDSLVQVSVLLSYDIIYSYSWSHHAAAKVKSEGEPEDDGHLFSPETKALLKGLSDSPESMQLKAEILSAANELKRGVNC